LPLAQAELIDNLCQRYSCLPSQLLAERADILLRIMALRSEAGETEAEGQDRSMMDSLANSSQVMLDGSPRKVETLGS
jgi:hypothetical protein